ncbi:UNVERIFIED_CONTAM: hypothetical protein K2H54_045500 [Gekko kuhli]
MLFLPKPILCLLLKSSTLGWDVSRLSIPSSPATEGEGGRGAIAHGGGFGLLSMEALWVHPTKAEVIFQRLDTDRDGAITFPEFACGFRNAARWRKQQQHQDDRGEPLDEEMAEEGHEQDGSDTFDILAGVAGGHGGPEPGLARI